MGIILLSVSRYIQSGIVEFIEEFEDREKRTSNLIFYNMEECDSARGSEVWDEDMIRELLQKIQPGKTINFSCVRLGKKRQGINRSLRVSLPSKRRYQF